VIGVLSLVVLVFVSSTVLKIMSGESSSLPPESTYLRVQVLNGCGITKAASLTADYIRASKVEGAEFDVIEIDNFESYEVTETMLIVRDERAIEYADKLAAELGANPDNVVLKFLDDNYLSIDITVIVGKDAEPVANARTGTE
jgi:hypothetical protein